MYSLVFKFRSDLNPISDVPDRLYHNANTCMSTPGRICIVGMWFIFILYQTVLLALPTLIDDNLKKVLFDLLLRQVVSGW